LPQFTPDLPGYRAGCDECARYPVYRFWQQEPGVWLLRTCRGIHGVSNGMYRDIKGSTQHQADRWGRGVQMLVAFVITAQVEFMDGCWRAVAMGFA